MISATVWFYGEKIGDRGLPEPFRSYLIVASPWLGKGRAIASVVPLSINAPEPPSRDFPVESGGQEAAFNAALEAIAKLPGNEGLNRSVDQDEAHNSVGRADG
jgi:hypothetical protein